MKKTVNLKNLFMVLKHTGRVVRYGDVMRAGVPSYLIDQMIKETNAYLLRDEEGYTIITFHIEK